MKKYKFLIPCAIVLLLASIGCSDNLNLAPTSKFTGSNYWISASKARMVLNTAYGQMSNAGWYFYNSALSDNAYIGRGDVDNVSTISKGLQTPSTPRFDSEWKSRYAGIKTCNVFLEHIDEVPNMKSSTRARMKAQDRFIRAYQYFMLTTLFGGVPYFTKPISIKKSKTIKRTPHDVIVDSIHATLQNIQKNLPVRGGYPTNIEAG